MSQHIDHVMRPKVFALLCFCLLSAACALGPNPRLDSDLDEILGPPELEGIRWGLVVTDLDGDVLLARRADERFLPASNTKLFTTAAAFRWQGELEQLALGSTTEVRLEETGTDEPPNLVLIGRGDPSVRDGPDCETQCLDDLAASVLKSGITMVGDVVGDDTWFTDERWLGGWSWEDLQEGYGTATSALVVNDNVLELTIHPGATPNEIVRAEWQAGDAFYDLEIEALTVAGDDATLRLERLPGTHTIVVRGQMQVGDKPRKFWLGLDSPAIVAAWRLKQALARNGIQVLGDARARSRHFDFAVQPEFEVGGGCVPTGKAVSGLSSEESLASLPASPWKAAAYEINKSSQNLYAELLLRQLGRLCGGGSSEEGLGLIRGLLQEAGVSTTGFDFSDGSGMSVYNRVSPRAITTLLAYAAAQDWGEDWRTTFPIGGVDGSLERRFAGTALEGRIFAKTGTLRGVNALSGYMVSASGRRLVFSIIANDRPLAVRSATPFMDAALARIAEDY